MTIRVTPKMKKLLEKRVKSGEFATPEDVIMAGLAALEMRGAALDFRPGELDRLLAEGDESFRNEATLTLEASYTEHLAHRQKRGRRQRKSA